MKIEPLLNSLNAMSMDFLSTVLDTLPVEFTIIDAEDNVLFWNRHGTRVFKRGPAIIGRNVRMCHPAASIDKVELVIERLKSGEEDYIDFWIDLPDGEIPRKLLIRYYALRDEEGNHLGILETTINLTSLQAYTGEFRLSNLD